jgi:ABC-type transport system involved in multi-copper enzyme maturation permease subunit
MTTTALTGSRKQTQAIGRPNPLLAVLVWELRRFRASRLFWIQALCFFGLLLCVLWFEREPDTFSFHTFSAFVAGTSAWGLVELLPFDLLVLLVFLLPFVNADGVMRDLQRRTHELLMTTALPTQAYVWGRYLMGLLVSLGLALLLLVAILGTGLLLHLTITDYPAPAIGGVLMLWVGMVVPATILLSSVSFALGTLLPRQSTLVKIVILVAWFIGALILPSGLRDNSIAPPAWYSAWDPTSAVTARGINFQDRVDFTSVPPTSRAQLQQAMLTIENRLTDIGTWLVPHLVLAGLSLVLVVLAAFAFQRFRSALNG